MTDQEARRNRLARELERAEAIHDRAAITMLRARIAADTPAYVGSDEAQAALAEAAELARIARRKARPLAPGEWQELYGR